jgi:Bax protein
LREKRAAVRDDGGSVTGYELAKTLTKYSERGEDYVHSLHAIMRVNKLGPTDQAHFTAGTAIELVPVEVED